MINTGPGPIAIGTQFQGDGNPQFDIRASLTIGLVRIHSGVLSDQEIEDNYNAEKDRFTVPEFIPRLVLPAPADLDDCVFADAGSYTRELNITGDPAPDLVISVDPPQASASVAPEGIVTIDLNDPAPASFDVTVTATNTVGGMAQELVIDWTVTVLQPLMPGDPIQVAGELFVDLNAADPSAGTAVWTNNGTAGDFNMVGAPSASSANSRPSVALNIDQDGDAYVTAGPAPAGMVGPDATCTVEVWVYNPTIEDEESLVSWSKRGSAGRNMSFNYGSSGIWGAAARWSADMHWDPLPAAAEWHHLALTYDGQLQRAYANGVENNTRFLGAGFVNIFDDTPITLGNQREGDGSLATAFRFASVHIGRVRIHDKVLKPEQIVHNYNTELPDFTGPVIHCVNVGDDLGGIISGAQAGDTVELAEGVHAGGRLLVNKDLTIRPKGTGGAATVSRVIVEWPSTQDWEATVQPGVAALYENATSVINNIHFRIDVSGTSPSTAGGFQIAKIAGPPGGDVTFNNCIFEYTGTAPADVNVFNRNMIRIEGGNSLTLNNCEVRWSNEPVAFPSFVNNIGHFTPGGEVLTVNANDCIFDNVTDTNGRMRTFGSGGGGGGTVNVNLNNCSFNEDEHGGLTHQQAWLSPATAGTTYNVNFCDFFGGADRKLGQEGNPNVRTNLNGCIFHDAGGDSILPDGGAQGNIVAENSVFLNAAGGKFRSAVFCCENEPRSYVFRHCTFQDNDNEVLFTAPNAAHATEFSNCLFNMPNADNITPLFGG